MAKKAEKKPEAEPMQERRGRKHPGTPRVGWKQKARDS